MASEIGKIGRRALVVVADVADDASVTHLINQADRHFGRLDAVLANAGYGITGGGLDLPEDQIRNIYEVNFFGTLRVLRAALPVMREQGGGHLLLTSSCLARFPLPYYGHYSATKAAQSQVGRALSLELAPENIDVSVVYPITTLTEFFDVTAQNSRVERTGIPEHAPKMFVQPASRVADAIVRCLKRPRPEVWTSHIVRISAAMMVAFPWFQDMAMRKEARRNRHNLLQAAALNAVEETDASALSEAAAHETREAASGASVS